MTKQQIEDIKSTINWLLENGDFKDTETAYNSAMNSVNTLDVVMNFTHCCMELNACFKIGDKIVSKNGRIAEIIGFPKHGHARVRNDIGGGIWQPNIAEIKLHKSV